jgi:hypothetical protein
MWSTDRKQTPAEFHLKYKSIHVRLAISHLLRLFAYIFQIFHTLFTERIVFVKRIP